MSNSDFITLALAIVAALASTALFLIGLWEVVRTGRTGKTIRTIAGFIAGKLHPLTLARAVRNPILTGEHSWEAGAVMNPAAVVGEDGKVHLFYRAIGADGVSRIGYASSRDGVSIDERLPHPVFAAWNPHGGPTLHRHYAPSLYPSGGSWGGVEDPRAVLIDNTVHITFNMFDGWDNIRVAHTSLPMQDVEAKRWRWTPPKLLSPAGQRHKNWMLFPEKIGGKFALLHNLHSERDDRVRIEYITDIQSYTPSTNFESADPNAIPDRPIAWHKRMRSSGPPPVKTKDGWVLLYHGTDNESSRYKMGAALLDLNDPSRVIARANVPVFEPDASYENNGAKPGIVYGCGAVVKDDNLMVYYGGSDSFVCAAATPLQEFVDHLLGRTKHVAPKTSPILTAPMFATA